MKNFILEHAPKTITLAELCQALADGHIQAQVEDGMYVVRNRDLVRLARTREVRVPAIATLVPNNLGQMIQAS